ncbi:unnamed protein product [Parnassius apollo]|uniref:(apollo) hypothetical protein n=1 Tax=Parnassius apollo TaxID=110799 RepID=A0A8S3XKN9_PARAO|nr:unnamed protein product [Parnassius apollo]
MATRRNTLRTVQNLRSKRILALVPQENAQSDISGTSNSENELEDEVYNFQSRASESSEAPSIDSALERLDIDFSDDNYPNTAPTDHTGYDETDNYDDDHQANNFSLTSISSLPTLSPMSNIPSMTPSFIINQFSDWPFSDFVANNCDKDNDDEVIGGRSRIESTIYLKS